LLRHRQSQKLPAAAFDLIRACPNPSAGFIVPDPAFRPRWFLSGRFLGIFAAARRKFKHVKAGIAYGIRHDARESRK
jgi:hypothetical protein